MPTQPWLTSADVQVVWRCGALSLFGWRLRTWQLPAAVHGVHRRASGYVAFSRMSLSLNPRCLLTPIVLSSLCMGPGNLLDPFIPLPSPAQPHLGI